MKKHLFIALAALMTAASMSAEIKSPYTEQFENPSFRPVGWKNIVSSSYSAGSYTTSETGGHSGGYITASQYSNYFSSYYNNYNYCDLLATPRLSGEVSIWVRKTAPTRRSPSTSSRIRTPCRAPIQLRHLCPAPK
ncbi:MAG: hypothetical protein K2F77_04240 [Muribaculaceae bacterium]|nr:hypothetical protein [Muribaculaceae bacterium]